MSIDTTVNTIGETPSQRPVGEASFGAETVAEERQRYPIFRSCLFSALALFGLGAATAGIIAANKKPEVQRRPFTPLGVMASTALQRDVPLTVTTQGEARPRVEIDLVPQVGGKIVYVSPNFIDGGIFKRGETLVRIDPSDFEVGVTRAEAAVAQAQQVLTREVAEGEIARADYEELGRGEPSPLALRVPQRQQAEASVKAAMADLGAAKLQLDRTQVNAPFAGRVRSKASDIGQFVSPGARLGRIFSTDVIEVRLPFTNADLAKIDLPIAYSAESWESAPKVVLTAQLGGQLQQWEGRIMRTDATFDTQSRALFAIAEVRDPFGSGASQNGVPIAPGLFVDARVEGRTLGNAIVIPRDALRVDNEVYVVDNTGQAEIRRVEVLDTTAERAVLRSGIDQGELVIMSPMERSRVSMPLEVRDFDNPENVIVKPEEPAWMKKKAEDSKSADKKTRRGWFGRKTDDTETSDDADAEDGETEPTDTSADETTGSDTP